MSFLDRLRRRTNQESQGAPAASDPQAAEFRTAMGDALISDLLKERRSERNWKHIKRIVISGSALVLFAIYVGFYVTSLGYHMVPNSDIIGVVRITGAIEDGSQTGSANAIIPALSKAFNKPNVKAVVVAIDSPGGQPGEAERIYDYITAKRRETGKPVISVIGNTGASAAYMIAVHTDAIYAGKYSLVGSVGAILSSWDFHKVAERFSVQRKIYASGSLKGMLDPWAPSTPEAEAKAHDLVNMMGRRFVKEVQELRGAKLKPNVDYATGEVWTGDQAFELGLIDGVDTLDSVIKKNYKLGYHDFGPTKGGRGLGFPFSGAMGDWLVGSLADAVATRLASGTHN